MLRLVLCLFVWFNGMHFTHSGPVMEHYACFSAVFEIACAEENQMIVFEEARYGSNDTTIAQRCHTPYQKKCDIDVHVILNRQCSGKRRCSLAVNRPLFGDPCGYDEFLKVKYKCVTDVSHYCYGQDSKEPVFDNGYISSPNYPAKYYRDAECTWSLAVQHRQTIRITLYDFELDVKKNGECRDFLEISSQDRVYFKDCGAQGMFSLVVDSSTALIRFKTGANGLTQRGFLLHFTALGPGCPDIENLPHGDIFYYVLHDVLFANASCYRGYVFHGTLEDHMQYKCSDKNWIPAVRECTAIPPNTTPIGLLPPTRRQETTTEDTTGVIIGIALGVVSVLLLLTLLLVLLLYWHKRRRHQKSDKGDWRVVMNNQQENEINMYEEEERMKSNSFTFPQHAKKMKKNKNEKDEEFYNRRPLVHDDSHDAFIPDYTDPHSSFPVQSTPVKGTYDEPIYKTSSRRNSRSSKYGFNRQNSREKELDSMPVSSKNRCVECGTPRPQSQKDLRHKRTKSGHWEPNKTYAHCPSSPDVPVYGTSKALTQSAPDLLELQAEEQQQVAWTLHPDQPYGFVPATHNHMPLATENSDLCYVKTDISSPKSNRFKKGEELFYNNAPADIPGRQFNDIRC